MVKFKPLPMALFGELLQTIYDVELNIKIESEWDDGYDFLFGDTMNGYQPKYLFLLPIDGIEEAIQNKGIGNLSGLIIITYMFLFDGRDTEGEKNKMYHFLYTNGFIEHYKDLFNEKF